MIEENEIANSYQWENSKPIICSWFNGLLGVLFCFKTYKLVVVSLYAIQIIKDGFLFASI